MILAITQDIFEHFVPSFATPNNGVFERIQDMIETECWQLSNFADLVDIESNSECKEAAQRYVCLRSAYLAIPSLDLVLSGSGFGVVSNSNLAPASPHRVAALRENLRREYGMAFDILVKELMRTKWAGTIYAHRFFAHLFPSAVLLRNYGIVLEDGGTPSTPEDCKKVRPKLASIIADVEKVISPELVEVLTQFNRCDCANLHEQRYVHAMSEDHRKYYRKLLHKVRETIAIGVGMKEYNNRFFLNKLLDFVRVHEEIFIEYRDSPTAAAHRQKTYKNGKNDASFFFG